MLKQILTVLLCIVLIGCFAAGCKRTSTQSEATEAVKTEAEYKAQAEQEITKENMASELDKLEQGIEQDSAAEN
jgi:hypothetical protein